MKLRKELEEAEKEKLDEELSSFEARMRNRSRSKSPAQDQVKEKHFRRSRSRSPSTGLTSYNGDADPIGIILDTKERRQLEGRKAGRAFLALRLIKGDAEKGRETSWRPFSNMINALTYGWKYMFRGEDYKDAEEYLYNQDVLTYVEEDKSQKELSQPNENGLKKTIVNEHVDPIAASLVMTPGYMIKRKADDGMDVEVRIGTQANVDYWPRSRSRSSMYRRRRSRARSMSRSRSPHRRYRSTSRSCKLNARRSRSRERNQRQGRPRIPKVKDCHEKRDQRIDRSTKSVYMMSNHRVKQVTVANKASYPSAQNKAEKKTEAQGTATSKQQASNAAGASITSYALRVCSTASSTLNIKSFDFKSHCESKHSEDTEMRDKSVYTIRSTTTNDNLVKEAIFYVDSAAQEHVVSDLTLLQTRETLRTPLRFVGVDSNSVIEARVKGEVHLIYDKELYIIKDAYYVPKAKVNLLSVQKLVKTARLNVSFSIDERGEERFTIADSKRKIQMKGVLGKKSGHYELKGNALCHLEKEVILSSTEKGSLWHDRMGHPSAGVMAKMKNMNVGIPGDISFSEKVCEACCAAKAQRAHLEPSGKRAKEAVQLVHADLFGPMPENRLNVRYAMFIIDDASMYAYCYLLKSKDKATTLQALKIYVAEVERVTGQKLKTIRTDNGTEFVNDVWKSFLSEAGIVHERSAPYTQAQNGRAERFNRTVISKARAMLIHAKLDARYCADAIIYAVYLHNRTYSRTVEGIPFEIFTKKEADVSHIRTFGATCYAKKNVNESKFESRAVKGILLGIPSNTKAYTIELLEEPHKGTVVVTANCKFEESNKLKEGSRQYEMVDDEYSFMEVEEEEEEDDGLKDADEKQGQMSAVPMSLDSVGASVYVKPEREDDSDLANSVGAREEKKEQATVAKRVVDASTIEKLRRRGLSVENIKDEAGRSSTRTGLRSTITPSERAVRAWEVTDEDLEEHIRMRNRIVVDHIEPVADKTEEMGKPKSIFITYKQAVEKPEWRAAMDTEISQLMEQGVFEIVNRVDVPTGRKMLRMKWVLREKPTEDGKMKYKGRLVAMGNLQDDMEETYAPVAHYSSVRLLVALAAMWRWRLRSFDITGAYLNAVLRPGEEEYLIPPPGMVIPPGSVLRLRKALYGLKQAGRRWNETLNTTLQKMGYKRSEYDGCLYRKYGDGGVIAILAVVVDDFLVATREDETLEEFQMGLTKEYTVTRKDLPLHYVGMHITMSKKGYSISQREYVESILKEYRMEDAHPQPTPQSVDILPREEGDDEFPKQISMRKVVGSLLYVAVNSRPDIAFTVNRLASVQDAPNLEHWKAIKRLMRYLRGTAEYSLTYKFGMPPSRETLVYAFSDADYATDKSDRQSVSGSILYVNGAPVVWKSRKQACVTTSTAEAEMVACTLTVKEVLFMKYLLSEIGFCLNYPIPVMEDNKAVIEMSRNPGQLSGRAKHVDISHRFCLQQAQMGNVVLLSVCSASNAADVLTKRLSEQVHQNMVKLTLGCAEGGSVDIIQAAVKAWLYKRKTEC
jgi:hypothetical protein